MRGADRGAVLILNETIQTLVKIPEHGESKPIEASNIATRAMNVIETIRFIERSGYYTEVLYVELVKL
jgi:hypothetical protein